LRALDYRTGKVVWNHELGDGESIAGILTTAGHLVFTADNSGNLLALDPASGQTLWHLNIGGHLVASPMTYQIDGRQYVLIPVQDILYAFALPEHAVAGGQTQVPQGPSRRSSASVPALAPRSKDDAALR
jgi:alcohol dehydrogenase (cytochrome c)